MKELLLVENLVDYSVYSKADQMVALLVVQWAYQPVGRWVAPLVDLSVGELVAQ